MSRLARASLLAVPAVIAVALVLHARARANAPAGRYTISAGTVLDAKTKLTWQQTATALMVFSTTKAYCAGLGSTLGGTGWRLPTKKELLTLVDYSQAVAPLIDPVAFPGTPSTASGSFFWSSTPDGSALVGWGVNFSNGQSTSTTLAPTVEGPVRCVR